MLTVIALLTNVAARELVRREWNTGLTSGTRHLISWERHAQSKQCYG